MNDRVTKLGLPEGLLDELRAGLGDDPQAALAFEKWLRGHLARVSASADSARPLHRPQSAEVRRAVAEYFRRQVLVGLAEWRLNLAKMKLDSAGNAVRNALEEFEPPLAVLSSWSFDPHLFIVVEGEEKDEKPAELASRIFTAARRLLALPVPELRSLRAEGVPRALLERLPEGSEDFLLDLAELAVREGTAELRSRVDEIDTGAEYAKRVASDEGASRPIRFLAVLATKRRNGESGR